MISYFHFIVIEKLSQFYYDQHRSKRKLNELAKTTPH